VLTAQRVQEAPLLKSTYLSQLNAEPGVIAQPSTVAEAASVVEAAGADGRAIIPWGGGTGQAYGYFPQRADILLDLTRLTRVIAVEPGDLTITVEAGATLSDVQTTLAPHNQFLPLDPPSPERATIGGILATDAFGPSRPHYGKARDYLIGLTVIDAQGRLVKGGGKVVKNVTGYDTPKLHIGGLGTLGVLVEATFKVMPRPETSSPALFELEAEMPAATVAAFLHRVCAETAPALRLLRDEGGRRIVAFLYSGAPPVVKDARAQAHEIAARQRIAALRSLPRGMESAFSARAAPADALVVRVAGLPADEYARHEALARTLGPILQRIDTYPGSGEALLVLSGDFEVVAAARHLIGWAGESAARVAFVQAPAALRDPAAGIPLWSPLPPSLRLMRRLKETLDPAGILNPGRFLDGL
jgi:glycolate oxidase FAD binding subunit